MVTRAVSWI